MFQLIIVISYNTLNQYAHLQESRLHELKLTFQNKTCLWEMTKCVKHRLFLYFHLQT
jgi:hypothetical protein